MQMLIFLLFVGMVLSGSYPLVRPVNLPLRPASTASLPSFSGAALRRRAVHTMRSYDDMLMCVCLFFGAHLAAATLSHVQCCCASCACCTCSARARAARLKRRRIRALAGPPLLRRTVANAGPQRAAAPPSFQKRSAGRAGELVGAAGRELDGRQDAALPRVLLDGLAAGRLLPGDLPVPAAGQAAAGAAVRRADGAGRAHRVRARGPLGPACAGYLGPSG